MNTNQNNQAELDSALIDTVREGNLKKVESLINRGADIEAADKDGMKPVHWAALGNHLNIIKHLAKQGANMHAPNNEVITPMYLAILNGHSDVMNFFLDSNGAITKTTLEHTSLEKSIRQKT